MALIKCDNCGKEISSKAKNCIYCGVKIRNFKNDINDNRNNNRIEKNIKFFLCFAKILKIIIFLFAGLNILVGIMTQNERIFIVCFILSIIWCLMAILSTPFLEWKAYVLKNLYELNKGE